MKKIITALVLLLLLRHAAIGQDSALFSRLRAMSDNATNFYNVDGYQITSEHFKDAFSTGSIIKHYRRYTIREEDLQAKDDSLPMNNFCVFRTDNKAPGVTEYVSYYFVEYPDKSLTGVTFACVNKTDRPFERHFVQLVYDTMISKTLFTPTPTRTVNFPGQEFPFGNSCRWMGVNNLQCSPHGQMNWSIHKELADARRNVDAQMAVNKTMKGIKVIADTVEEVVFEGQQITAKKVTYDFTGVRSVLVAIGGGKTLTVYYVAAMVGNDAVSCVMSFWNNDHLGPDGLPGLLEEVMTPKRSGK
jgi:hypothetical protein